MNEYKTISNEEVSDILAKYGIDALSKYGQKPAVYEKPLIDIEKIQDPFVKKMASVKNRHTISIPPKNTNPMQYVVSG